MFGMLVSGRLDCVLEFLICSRVKCLPVLCGRGCDGVCVGIVKDKLWASQLIELGD